MKIGILTINDNNNLGNRLQNYALQSYLKKYGEIYTIINETRKSSDNIIINKLKNIKFKLSVITNSRYKYFKEFNKNISFYKKKIDIKRNQKKIDNYFDFFITGSDQVWNPKLKRFSKLDFLSFTSDEKKISYAASIGINSLEMQESAIIKNSLAGFKYISVREEQAKKILKKLLNRDDIVVNIDPTMLIKKQEWESLMKKPNNFLCSNYVLCYFLGKISKDYYYSITRYAAENKLNIIDISDKNSIYYNIGPSEFLYLIKNSKIVLTDSFHACVFSFLFDKSFIVFKRDNKSPNMYSRIETLISNFKLNNREYNGKNITKENIEHDYSKAYNILENERKKSEAFLRKALSIDKQK